MQTRFLKQKKSRIFFKKTLKKVCRFKKWYYFCNPFSTKMENKKKIYKFFEKFEASLKNSNKYPQFQNRIENNRSWDKYQIFYNEEFDPGSGWTLAAGLIHASRTVSPCLQGTRVAHGCVTRMQPTLNWKIAPRNRD